MMPNNRSVTSKTLNPFGKLSNLSFQKTHPRFHSIPIILKNEEDREVHEFMKKVQF